MEIEHIDAPTVDDGAPLTADPMAAIDKLTQLKIASATVAAHACGAVSLLAATLATRGYAGLSRLAKDLRGEMAEEHAGDILRFAEAAASGGEDATYGALAGFAEIIQRRYRGFDGGMPYEKLRHLMRVAGFQAPKVIDDDDVARTVTRAGQCWPAKIALDGGDAGDHWILVGRCARGELFLYDPYPRADESQIVRPREEDFRKYVEAIG